MRPDALVHPIPTMPTIISPEIASRPRRGRSSSVSVLRRPVDSAQYTSWVFGHHLRAAGVLGSMGSIGAYDNAMAESFFSTLQRRLLDEHRWATRHQLALAVF